MKRTAVVLGILAAMGVAPSLANAANPQIAETQLAKTQIVRSALVESALARPGLTSSAALTARKASISQHARGRLAR